MFLLLFIGIVCWRAAWGWNPAKMSKMLSLKEVRTRSLERRRSHRIGHRAAATPSPTSLASRKQKLYFWQPNVYIFLMHYMLMIVYLYVFLFMPLFICFEDSIYLFFCFTCDAKIRTSVDVVLKCTCSGRVYLLFVFNKLIKDCKTSPYLLVGIGCAIYLM